MIMYVLLGLMIAEQCQTRCVKCYEASACQSFKTSDSKHNNKTKRFTLSEISTVPLLITVKDN